MPQVLSKSEGLTQTFLRVLKKPFKPCLCGAEMVEKHVNGTAINMLKHDGMSENVSQELSDHCPNIKNQILQLDKSQGPGLSLSTYALQLVSAVSIFV